MKTLIIDNYDSFTYNLAQLVESVSGSRPIVIENRQIELIERTIGDCDNLIISPGPGHPENRSDIGDVLDVIRSCHKPILGVCLGMQAIAVVCGATIKHAPEPFHGRTSEIFHRRDGLFRGLPSPFNAARYHSLMAILGENSPLILTAWTDTEIPMAIAHVNRPIYGVQFHPESIATEYGGLLIDNFFRMQSDKDQAVISVSMANRLPSENSLSSAELDWVALDLKCEASTIFSDLFSNRQYSFWLDGNAEHYSQRFSYMGAVSKQRGFFCSYVSRSNTLTIHSFSDTQTVRESEVRKSIFDFLEGHLANRQLQKNLAESQLLPFDFKGGFVGYFGYELKGELGGNYVHNSDLPDACFIYIDEFIVIDHEQQKLYVVVIREHGNPGACVDGSALLEQVKRLNRRYTELNSEIKSVSSSRRQVQVTYSQDRAAYIDSIHRAQEHIRDGESYQLCLTNQIVIQTQVDALNLYLRLRAKNPAPYSAYLSMGSFSILSSSPERFLRLDKQNILEAKPIKGSIRRGSNHEDDCGLATNLQNSQKNRSENLMIVDLLRNDLGRVSKPGSVHVQKLIEIETYATVHHLVSTIRSTPREGVSAIDCIKSAFPGGSMTGAPKIRSMDILDSLELCARGVYSGALGYLSLDGTFDLSIVIRTIVAQKDRLSIGSGGGIVALSNPEEEFAEMELKASVLLETIKEAAF